MGYRNLKQGVEDLSSAGHLVQCDHSIDAHLQLAEIQRRLYSSGSSFYKYQELPIPNARKFVRVDKTNGVSFS